MYIDGREVGDTAAAPYVIAELGSTHEGRIERAEALTRAAVDAGADAVKFQIWSRDENTTPDHPDYPVLGPLEFDADQWRHLLGFARALGATVMVDVDDPPAVGLAVECGASALKIRTTNIGHPELLRQVAAQGLPVLVATGASTMAEIEPAVGVLQEHGARDLILLHGFQAFPTPAADTHLRTIGLLRQRFTHPVGYADHADGGSPLAFLLPAAALAAGACVIEKHLSIDRERETQDFESALNGPEFAHLVARLRDVWAALGRPEHDLSAAEQTYRERFKKSAVARRAIAAGEPIDADMLAFKRAPRLGIGPRDVDQLIGRRAAVDIPADALVLPDGLQG